MAYTPRAHTLAELLSIFSDNNSLSVPMLELLQTLLLSAVLSDGSRLPRLDLMASYANDTAAAAGGVGIDG